MHALLHIVATRDGVSVFSWDRLARRNGYRDRLWETRVGTVELRIPKLRRAATSRFSGAASAG